VRAKSPQQIARGDSGKPVGWIPAPALQTCYLGANPARTGQPSHPALKRFHATKTHKRHRGRGKPRPRRFGPHAWGVLFCLGKGSPAWEGQMSICLRRRELIAGLGGLRAGRGPPVARNMPLPRYAKGITFVVTKVRSEQ